MKSNYLLSNKFKVPGWILLSFGVITGICLTTTGFELDILTIDVFSIYSDNDVFSSGGGFFKIMENSIVDELIALIIIIGGLLVGFSKEKIEDEFIYKIRTDSLVWAIVVNYIILMFAIIFIYEFTFFDVLVYNMFTPLLFFIIRFNFLKARA
ncbi:hypothetical protein [Psychroserpens damuponensis]|uniref:hypothetical protein n=1 Tax=Psychroserpens damuponensis TaxID=943936 RepID=UPI00058AEEB3|nr:hypothetical protein [Psychroserpens damuponensis]